MKTGKRSNPRRKTREQVGVGWRTEVIGNLTQARKTDQQKASKVMLRSWNTIFAYKSKSPKVFGKEQYHQQWQLQNEEIEAENPIKRI